MPRVRPPWDASARGCGFVTEKDRSRPIATDPAKSFGDACGSGKLDPSMACRAEAWVALVVSICVTGCFGRVQYGCEDAEQCQVGSAQGFCEANGECAYIDETCGSGRRYSPFADPSRAQQCVEEDVATDASTSVPTTTMGTSTSSSSSATAENPTIADSGSTASASSSGDCDTDCPQPGELRWATVDEALGRSEGRALTLLTNTVVVSGLLGVESEPGLLVAQYTRADGGVGMRRDALDGYAFAGEAVAAVSDAGIVVAGSGPSALGALRGNVVRLDARGELLWSDAVDTVNDDVVCGVVVVEPTIIVVGNSGSEAWTRSYAEDGTASPPLLHHPPGPEGTSTPGRWHAAAGQGSGVLLAGSASPGGQEQVWLRRIGIDGSLEVEVVHPPLLRALAVAPAGPTDVFAGGVTDGSAWIGRLGGTGGFDQTTVLEDADAVLEIAPTPEGGLVAVGSAGDDAWARRLAPGGRELWRTVEANTRFNAVRVAEDDVFIVGDVGEGAATRVLVHAYVL